MFCGFDCFGSVFFVYLTMDVKIKITSENAIVPVRANSTDAGFDCYASSINETENYLEYGLGFQLEIPTGFFGLILARSSITNFDLMVKNSAGIIDSGYRGEMKLRLKKFGDKIYSIGDRVCQLIILPYPEINLVLSENLDDVNDRKGGFGSSGVN